MSISPVFAIARNRSQRLARPYRLLWLVVALIVTVHLATTQLYVKRPVEDYSPGWLGTSLVARHRNITQTPKSLSWQVLRGQADNSLFAWPEGDGLCDDLEAPAGFEKEEIDSRACWRLKLLQELDSWIPHKSFKTWQDQEVKNTAALARLRRCLLQPLSAESQGPENCSMKATKIVIGHFWWWTMGFTKAGLSGEAIWTASMIDALEEQGYTVLSVSEYEGMVQAHAEIPNLISHMFVDEKIMLTCLADPFCLSADEFRPTQTWFPQFIFDGDGEPVRTYGMRGNREGEAQRWVWTEEELQKLDDAAERGVGRPRGTIPLHKLFVLTWWGTKLGQGYWPIPEGFSWNPLGHEWTISPFNYPDHTFMPYSIERECSAVPLARPAEKQDRAFILAKLAEYFYDERKAPPTSVWHRFQWETGLRPVSVGTDREDGARGWLNFTLPDGVARVGPFNREEFEVEVGKSKVMVGIGRPYISPSVYTSLCQGTPVVLPFFAEPEKVYEGYNLFAGEYAQHGPASLIGPPYVYTYQHSEDPQELLDLVSEAASRPIDRYIPDDMTWSAVKKDVDDVMLFDWKTHAERVRASRPLINPDRLDVHGRCFEIGRCKSLSPEKP